MSGAKHTPGPWEVELYMVDDAGMECYSTTRGNLRKRRRIVADTMIIADMVAGGRNDARLIAAAPDLLEALEMCARFFGADEWEWGDGTPFDTSRIRAAIRAARGETP